MHYNYNILNKYNTQNNTYIQNQYLNGNLKKLDADLIKRAQKRHYKALRKQIREVVIDYMIMEKKLLEFSNQFKVFTCNMPNNQHLLNNVILKLKKECVDFIMTFEINSDGYEHIHFMLLSNDYIVSDLISYLHKRDIHVDFENNNLFLDASQMFDKFKYMTKCYRNISILKSSLRTMNKVAFENRYVEHFLKLLSQNTDRRKYLNSSVKLNTQDKAYMAILEARLGKKFDLLQFINSDEVEDFLTHWKYKGIETMSFNKLIDEVVNKSTGYEYTGNAIDAKYRLTIDFNEVNEKYLINLERLFNYCCRNKTFR